MTSLAIILMMSLMLLGCSASAQRQTATAPAAPVVQSETDTATPPAGPAVPVDRLAGLRLRRLGPREPGRGGIEGEPVSMDSAEPKYRAYFAQLRRGISEKWMYPHEAGVKRQGGSLLIETYQLR